MQLSIIIVSYNTRKLLTECLQSVFSFLADTIAFEAIVVDNGSHDGSPAAVRELALTRPNLRLIETGSNLGFAKANNIGIRHAVGKQVLLLNSDTYLIDDSVIHAVNFLDGRPDLFGCGCTLLNKDGSFGISYGNFPEAGVIFREVMMWRLRGLQAVVPRESSNIHPIDFPCGAFFLMRREHLEKIGPLDERFFMYCEETDLARRAMKAGYRLFRFGPARVVHLGGQSNPGDGKPLVKNPDGPDPVDMKALYYQSWRRYLEKHCTTPSEMAVGMLISLYLRLNSLIFQLLRREKAHAQYTREIKAFRTGWRSAGIITNEQQ
jgi:GT2 family glycosyltransferase